MMFRNDIIDLRATVEHIFYSLWFSKKNVFFRKRTPKNVPRHVPTYVKIHENTLPTRPKKVTCAHRESNRPPPASKSEGLPTRLFRPQNLASVKILYASKIRGVCPRARRVLPQPKLRPRGSSAAKIAPPGLHFDSLLEPIGAECGIPARFWSVTLLNPSAWWIRESTARGGGP